jgi:hypothetical protein
MSGVLAFDELPGYEEGRGLRGGVGGGDLDEEEFDIEVTEEEAPFLAGQLRAARELSPVKLVANPDGSLSRAAMTASGLAKERRELKVLQQGQLLDAIPKDLERAWADPMAAPGERHLAALRDLLLGPVEKIEHTIPQTNGTPLVATSARVDVRRVLRSILSDKRFPPNTFVCHDLSALPVKPVDGEPAAASRFDSYRVRTGVYKAAAKYNASELAVAIKALADGLGMEDVLFTMPVGECEVSTLTSTGGAGGCDDAVYGQLWGVSKWAQTMAEMTFCIGVIDKQPVGKVTRTEDKMVRASPHTRHARAHARRLN